MSSYNKPHLRNDSVPPFSLFPSILTKLKTCSHIFKKILNLTGIFTTLIWEYHYLYTVHQFKSFIETVSVMMAADQRQCPVSDMLIGGSLPKNGHYGYFLELNRLPHVTEYM